MSEAYACRRCGESGHTQHKCKVPEVWCTTCNSKTHNNKACWKKTGSASGNSTPRKQSPSPGGASSNLIKAGGIGDKYGKTSRDRTGNDRARSLTPGGKTYRADVPRRRRDQGTNPGWMSRGNSVDSVNSRTGKRDRPCYVFARIGKCVDANKCPYKHGESDTRDLSLLKRQRKPQGFARSRSPSGARGQRASSGGFSTGASS